MSKFGDAVKKINARLEVFERRGLTGTWEYEQLRAQLATAAGDNMTLDSKGYTHISGRGLSSTQKEQIMRASKSRVTSATHAEQRLLKEHEKAFGDTGQSRRERVEHAAQLERDVHDFIKKHAADIYKIAHFSAMVHRHNNLTPQEAEELLNMYNSPEWQMHLDLVSIDQYKQSAPEIEEVTAYELDMLDDLRAAQADLYGELEEAGTDAHRENIEIHIAQLEEQISELVKRIKSDLVR